MNGNAVRCPACETVFTNTDVREYEKHKAVYILSKHGLSLRAISRLFGWNSPEQAKVRLDIYEKKLSKETE